MTAIIDQIAKQLSNRLLASGSILTTAESCTGGWLAEAITSVAGSSAYFDRGYVCYSNQSKQDLLGVKHSTLEKFGAVSSETAIEMANGAHSLLASSIAQPVISVAITGVAGPTGGSDEKPVGTVFIAWYSQTESLVRKELFMGDRHEIRLQAVFSALNGLLEIT